MKKEPQIHIITKYFWPVAAGIETNILETYASLARTGWSITAHASTNSLTQDNAYPQGREEVRGIAVNRYFWRPFGFWPQLDWQSADLICLHNFNIVPHAFFMIKTIWLKLLGQKQYSLVLTPHGGYNPEWSIFPKLQRTIKSFYHRTLGTWLINASVDAVRAVSEWERQEMIGWVCAQS